MLDGRIEGWGWAVWRWCDVGRGESILGVARGSLCGRGVRAARELEFLLASAGAPTVATLASAAAAEHVHNATIRSPCAKLREPYAAQSARS